MSKICSICNELKEQINFRKTKRWYSTYCKICERDKRRVKVKIKNAFSIPDNFVRYKNSNYFLNKKGDILSCQRGRLKKLKPGNVKGYRQLRIIIDDKKIASYIHRLIAEIFIPNPNNLPYVNHINNITHDNRVENLEWVTEQQNCDHMVACNRQSKGVNRPNSVLTEDEVLEIRYLYKNTKTTHRKLAEKYNVNHSTIYDILNRKTWKHI